MMEKFKNLVKQALYPGDIENAIQNTALLIDRYEQNGANEDNKFVLRQHPDQLIKNKLPPETPIYEIFQNWKETLTPNQFQDGMDYVLSAFQNLLEKDIKSNIQHSASDKEKLEFLLDQIPLIRRDLRLPEQSQYSIAEISNETTHELQEDLTNQ